MVTISDKEFEKIYKAHYKIVVNVAYLIVSDRGYARDVAQEVFLKLYNYIGNGNDVRNLQAWLILTAKHTSIDFVRKFYKFKIISLDKDIEMKRNYAEEIVKRTYLTSILYNLKRKNKTWYDMLLMKYTLGLSTGEIARKFNCSNKTVENSLRRAKNYIKKENEVSLEDYILLLLTYLIFIKNN